MRLARSLLPVTLLGCGAALVGAAIVADGPWFVRHVAVPALYLPVSPWTASLMRGALVFSGAALIALAVVAARWRAGAGQIARVGLAVLLAVGAAELIVRRGGNGTTWWRARKLELRLGRPDPRFGNVLLPSRTTLLAAPGATPVSYAIDAWGNRAASDQGAPDPARPSLVFAGESIAVGHGLPFEETIAARLAASLDLQLVNVGAGGYGTDQAYLRLEEALSRLQKPRVVVMVFLPMQLERNVQDYRPRLVLREGALVLAPPSDGLLSRLRLRDLAVNELPMLGETKLRESLAVTAAVLRETAARARERGATLLFLVPVVGPRRPFESHAEAQFLRPLFLDQGLPLVLIDLDVSELIPNDGHPNAAASRRIAAALKDRLGSPL